MLDLRLTKGLVLGGMLLITAFFCLLPAFLISKIRTNHLESRGLHRAFFRYGISFLNCFACGVFMGTLFLDLQPDVMTYFKEALPKVGINTEYPLGQFCIVFGFLLVLTVERIVISCKTEGVNIFHGHKHEGRTEEVVVAPGRGRSISTVSNPDVLREQEIMKRFAMPNPYHPPHQQEEVDSSRGDFRTRRPSEVSLASNVDEPEILSSVASSRSTSPTRDLPSSSHRHTHSVEPSLRLVKSKSHQITHTARSLILLVALSLHSIFEGLAIGLQTSRQKVLEIFGALLIHKCVVAFSVGMNLMQSRMALKNVVGCALVFASATPLGVGIAIGMEGLEQDPGAQVASAVLQAFACGTFLFITFLEVLPHEMLKGSEGESGGVMLLKIVCMICGFSVMAGLMFMDS